MHVFNGFLEQLARDVEQELARQKAQKLPTAQHEATLDSLRGHQSVLELRFSPRAAFFTLSLPTSIPSSTPPLFASFSFRFSTPAPPSCPPLCSLYDGKLPVCVSRTRLGTHALLVRIR